MDLREMRYFVTVAEEGSISKAAGRLHISQPPLSVAIKKMEDNLGCELFSRNTRQMKLTDAGEFLLRRARILLTEADAMESDLRAVTAGAAGALHLGMISSSITPAFTRLLTEFHQQQPGVLLHISDADTYSLIEQVRKGMLEAAFVRTPYNAPDLDSMFLTDDTIAAAGDPMLFPVLNAGSVTLEQLSTEPLILYRRWRNIVSDAFVRNSLPFPLICLNDDARTTLSLASAGLGIAIAPKAICVEYDTSIRTASIVGLNENTQIHLVYQRTSHLPVILSRFIEFLEPERGTGDRIPCAHCDAADLSTSARANG